MARGKAVPVVEVVPDEAVVAAALARTERTEGTQLPPEGAERPPCLCGCGGFPKGAKARFIPGHDARYHAALKQAQAQSNG